ncbi:hypothetical protein L209DRAFT_756506 [Thermothelomyces heterothallicus CBS 203.75]
MTGASETVFLPAASNAASLLVVEGVPLPGNNGYLEMEQSLVSPGGNGTLSKHQTLGGRRTTKTAVSAAGLPWRVPRSRPRPFAAARLVRRILWDTRGARLIPDVEPEAHT